MQLANISTVARTIAAGPPYIRKVRKIKASPKLIANFERGSERVILGAINTPNSTMKRYPGERASSGKAATDAARHAAPAAIIASFERFEIFSLDIAEAI